MRALCRTIIQPSVLFWHSLKVICKIRTGGKWMNMIMEVRGSNWMIIVGKIQCCKMIKDIYERKRKKEKEKDKVKLLFVIVKVQLYNYFMSELSGIVYVSTFYDGTIVVVISLREEGDIRSSLLTAIVVPVIGRKIHSGVTLSLVK
jgi:hypothetical protein